MIDALRSFSNNKYLENDGSTNKFGEMFWRELKEPFMNPVSETKISKKSITSQRQAVMKLIER